MVQDRAGDLSMSLDKLAMWMGTCLNPEVDSGDADYSMQGPGARPVVLKLKDFNVRLI